MKIIHRKGSEVLIQDHEGEYWVTRRKKLRRNSRRQKKNNGVIYIKLHRISNPFFYIYNQKE